MNATARIVIATSLAALVAVLLWPVLQRPREGRRHVTPKYSALRQEGYRLEERGLPLEAARRYEASLNIRGHARLRYHLFDLYFQNRQEGDAHRILAKLIEDPNTPRELVAAHIVRISDLGLEAGMTEEVESMVDAALSRLTAVRKQLHLVGLGSPDAPAEVDVKGELGNPFPLIEWSENLNSKRAALRVAAALQYLHSMNYWDALSLCRKAITLDPAHAKAARIYAAYCVSQIPDRKPAELEGFLAGIDAKDPNLKKCLSIIRREAAKFAMR